MFGFGAKRKPPKVPNNFEEVAASSWQTFDCVSVNILNAADTGDGMEEVDIIELFDENGDSMDFEALAKAVYCGGNYCIITPYIEEPESHERSDVFIMQEVFDKDRNHVFKPVEDKPLVNRIFSAFRKASGDKFRFSDV